LWLNRWAKIKTHVCSNESILLLALQYIDLHTSVSHTIWTIRSLGFWRLILQRRHSRIMWHHDTYPKEIEQKYKLIKGLFMSINFNTSSSYWSNLRSKLFSKMCHCVIRALKFNHLFCFRYLNIPNQNGYHSPMHPNSPSPGLIPLKKDIEASTVRANLKLMVNTAQQLANKSKEEVSLKVWRVNV